MFTQLLINLLLALSTSFSASENVVISQVYGGGGNSGATFRNDFVELFNRGKTTVNLNGWAVQYASPAGSSWQKTDLAGTIAPGQYFLIQQASGGSNGEPLPKPDATGTISMAATAGKVMLTNNNALIASGVSCPSGVNVVDLVGYGGNANCFEGSSPAPAISSSTAALRADGGCKETDSNSSDFIASTVKPRTSALPAAVCGAQTNPFGVGAANPNPVVAGGVSLLTVSVTPGNNPVSMGVAVTGDLSTIGGPAAQQFSDDGKNGDVKANDNIFSFQAFVAANTEPGAKSLSFTVADAQSRKSNASIDLSVRTPLSPGAVVISQIFAAGGNSGAPFRNDFVELFNRSDAPVSIAGWSLQYATASGSSWQKVDLNATVAPGQYYLIQLASGGANGAALPAADASGAIGLSSSAGKIALVNNATLLNVSCPFGAHVVDLVGYGSGANCFEGSGPAPTPGSAKAVFRAGQGCGDSNDNAKNFSTAAPKPRNSKSPLKQCAPGDPAGPPPTISVSGDGQPGSVLIYPIYSSSAANLAHENSRISITNTDSLRQATVHLFFVDDDSASIVDAFICLSPHQTASFLASDFDPNVTGYLAAVAVDPKTGCPINFNFLIGDVYVRLGSGHAANLAAEAFSAASEIPATCNENSTMAEIGFDGVKYSAAPRVLVADSVPSVMDGNSTLLVINRIGGDLTTGMDAIGQVSGVLYDDAGQAFNFDLDANRRQFRSVLSNDIPRAVLRISNVIPAGRTGWMKFWRESDGGIIGATINFNPNAANHASAFNQGRNLHRLSVTTSASLTIPVFPPDC